MSETVLACPDCDRASLERAGEGYYCHACLTRVADGVERERRRAGTGLRGLAAKLDDADPDEVSADD